MGTNARWVSSALAAGVKHLLPSKRQTPITQMVGSLVSNRGGSEDEACAYLDPKFSPIAQPAVSRTRNPCTHAIIFITGPGNYLEYQMMREMAETVPALAVGAGRKVF